MNMSYSQLDDDYNRITNGDEHTNVCNTAISSMYAEHMGSFLPIAIPLNPASPPCVMVPVLAPILRKILTIPVFCKFPSLFIRSKSLLDCWVNQFVRNGFLVAPPLTGAFFPGPNYATALAKLNSASVLKQLTRGQKFSAWAMAQEAVFQTCPGFVQYIGQVQGVPCVYNIRMQYVGL